MWTLWINTVYHADISWSVPDSIANKHVLVALKKQAFKHYRGERESLDRMVAMLQNTVAQSNWQAAAMQQTPKRLWAHRNELTEYQYLHYLAMDTEEQSCTPTGRNND
ncbi:hypothetical protein PHPALM_28447 [Phytophthora palmivora]|uniref:Uncharacterized protein n=1 Tax=Phytophthora palmivora TaxID=4796 RepID=A0A2P4XA24_9STRA|nr:hypothetical protein PHPALM_28447 [Phytophthora palmivora]